MSKEKKPSLRSISFSSLSDHKKCAWYFYLKNILRLDVDTDSLWTHYGKLVHKYVQAVLNDEMEAEKAAKLFIRTWFKFCALYRKPLAKQLEKGEFKLPKGAKTPEKLIAGPVRAIMDIKRAFKEQFGQYTVLYIEERLKENTEFPQYFGGYVDIVIETKSGKIIIADFKTCSSHYMFNKYKDKYNDYQLTLYKHYMCKKYNLDPKKVETYFITIAKDPKVKKSTEFFRITAGPKKEQNALKWLNGVLSAVQKSLFVKNKMACRDFYGKSCPFHNSERCS